MNIVAIAQSDQVKTTVKKVADDLQNSKVSVLDGRLAEAMEKSASWQRADVIIVEMHLNQETDRAAFTDLVRKARGSVIVTADDAKVEDVRWLMRNDVSDFLPHPLSEAELANSLTSVAKQTSEVGGTEHAHAVILAVLAASKGLGAATVACQTAIRIREQAAKTDSVCLVDLDFQFGKVSTHLDVEGRLDIAEISNAPSRLDESFLSSLVVKHPSKIDVLAPIERLSLWENVTSEAVCRLMEIVAHAYDYVIVNMPPYWASWTSEILRGVDAVNIVFQVNVESIRHTRLLIDTIFENGGGQVPMFLHANRFKKKFLWFGVNMKDVEKALGREISFYVPDNPTIVTDSINRGVPLKEVKPGSDVEKAISDAADEILASIRQGRGAVAA